MGGTMVRKAVITSPQRRVDTALSIITQSAYRKSFGKKQSTTDALVNEILHAYKNDASKSEAIKEKERIERKYNQTIFTFTYDGGVCFKIEECAWKTKRKY